MTEESLRPTPLEIASSMVAGPDPDAAPLPDVDSRLSPLSALERAMLPALTRPPCLVSFSGGRDSSAVLAGATLAARREGLPLPVPISVRFPRAVYTEESTWQEIVVRHLGLTDWDRRDAADGEFDWVGPLAGSVLLRHGLLYPANAFFHRPLLEGARGGSLLTGAGGDQIMEGWGWQRVANVLARRTRPGVRDVLRLAQAGAPQGLKRARARRSAPRFPWLRPAAQKAMTAAWASQGEEPVGWQARVGWRARRRDIAQTRWSLDLLARDAGALIEHPLLEPRFLAALARAGGRTGFRDRTEVMRAICGDLLPEEVLARFHKAIFHEVYWGPHSRAFVERWRGAGVDPELVDEAALRAEWSKEAPIAASAMLVQSAWLASSADRQGGQSVHDAR